MDTKDEIKTEYEELMEKIDRWEKSVEDASDDKYADVKRKRDTLRSAWEEAKDTADDAWDGVKAGVRKSLDELKEAYNAITE